MLPASINERPLPSLMKSWYGKAELNKYDKDDYNYCFQHNWCSLGNLLVPSLGTVLAYRARGCLEGIACLDVWPERFIALQSKDA